MGSGRCRRGAGCGADGGVISTGVSTMSSSTGDSEVSSVSTTGGVSDGVISTGVSTMSSSTGDGEVSTVSTTGGVSDGVISTVPAILVSSSSSSIWSCMPGTNARFGSCPKTMLYGDVLVVSDGCVFMMYIMRGRCFAQWNVSPTWRFSSSLIAANLSSIVWFPRSTSPWD